MVTLLEIENSSVHFLYKGGGSGGREGVRESFTRIEPNSQVHQLDNRHVYHLDNRHLSAIQ